MMFSSKQCPDARAKTRSRDLRSESIANQRNKVRNAGMRENTSSDGVRERNSRRTKLQGQERRREYSEARADDAKRRVVRDNRGPVEGPLVLYVVMAVRVIRLRNS